MLKIIVLLSNRTACRSLKQCRWEASRRRQQQLYTKNAISCGPALLM
uniref:Uncharacterized protein n=1 Tax=Arundo donax TaxID=35708 RepID=A0A0A9AG23_ARUDO